MNGQLLCESLNLFIYIKYLKWIEECARKTFYDSQQQKKNQYSHWAYITVESASLQKCIWETYFTVKLGILFLEWFQSFVDDVPVVVAPQCPEQCLSGRIAYFKFFYENTYYINFCQHTIMYFWSESVGTFLWKKCMGKNVFVCVGVRVLLLGRIYRFTDFSFVFFFDNY